MHAPRAALRTSCSARNAYDPARALHRALCPTTRLGSVSAAELSTASPAGTSAHTVRVSPSAAPGVGRRFASSHVADSGAAGVSAEELARGKMADYLELQEQLAQKHSLGRGSPTTTTTRNRRSDSRPTGDSQVMVDRQTDAVGPGRKARPSNLRPKIESQLNGERQTEPVKADRKPKSPILRLSPRSQAVKTGRKFRPVTIRPTTESEVTMDSQEKPESLSSITNPVPNDRNWVERMKEVARLAGELAEMGSLHDCDDATLDQARAALSYEPMVIEPKQSPLTDPLPAPWAVDPVDVGPDTTFVDDMLSREIDQFHSYWSLSAEEHGAHKKVRGLVCSIVSAQMGRAPNRSGSGATGLVTPVSDIDLVLVQSRQRTEPALLALFEGNLVSALQLSSHFMLVTIRTHNFPIINVQHRETGIDVQIVMGPSTLPQTRVVCNYRWRYPNFARLYKVLYAALSMRGLIDVFNGGIGSYGLATMLAASLGRKSSYEPQSLGEQLLRFLDFWSELDTTRFGVASASDDHSFGLFLKHDTGQGALYRRHAEAARRRGAFGRAGVYAIGQRRPLQPYLLSLQDPTAAWNDLGRKSNAIRHVQATFDAMRTRLRADLAAGPAAVRARGPGEDTLLGPLVGPCHEVYRDRRRRVHAYGVEALREQEAKVVAWALKQTVSDESIDAAGPPTPPPQAHQGLADIAVQDSGSGADVADAPEDGEAELADSPDAPDGVVDETSAAASEPLIDASEASDVEQASHEGADASNGVADSSDVASDRSRDDGRPREAA